MATRPEEVFAFLRTIKPCFTVMTVSRSSGYAGIAVQQITATLALCSGFTRTGNTCRLPE
jgi:hypothetical protein